MNSRAVHSLLFLLLLALTACRQQVPEHYEQLRTLPPIYPDYAGVTVPVNIAPLNFEIFADADAAVTRFVVSPSALRSGKNDSEHHLELVCSGLKVRPDVDEWHQLLAAAQGETLFVEVYCRSKGEWKAYRPFAISVSPDSIDSWLSYRLISPSYVSYEELTINQRCLENFTEEVVVDNMLCSTEFGGQCVNCHNYQQYNPERMQVHARQTHGGTLIAYDGKLEKIDWNQLGLQSPGVYPSWHPYLKLIAYSTNKTIQAFHTDHPNKIEVLDAASDLILYDIDRHEVTSIEGAPDELEVFPFWAPDGKSLYYCSAHFEYSADNVSTEEIVMRAEEVKYNIYRKAFDPATRQFGERQLVFAADTLSASSREASVPDGFPIGKSATLPRISPDGRWLMFTLAQWGCFHIWHHDADLWIMDLSGKEGARPMTELNSPDTESYHSWSSNGCWVVFSSRRYDGVFTRPFIAHIDKDGHGSKPFELPTQDPDLHLQLLKSYNVPELMRGPVTLTPQQVAAKLKESSKDK